MAGNPAVHSKTNGDYVRLLWNSNPLDVVPYVLQFVAPGYAVKQLTVQIPPNQTTPVDGNVMLKKI
jgi:hypothetical protein